MVILRKSKLFSKVYPHSPKHSKKSDVGKTDSNGNGYVTRDLSEDLKEQLQKGLVDNPNDTSRNFVGPIVAANLPQGDNDDHYDNYLALAQEYVGGVK